MDIQPNIEQRLDELIVKAKVDANYLESLLAAFSDCASQSDLNLIKKYGHEIDVVCKNWEGKNSEARGIKLLINMLADFYSTNFQKVAESGLKTIEVLSSSKHQDLYGLACMIYGANNRSLGNFDVAVDYLIKGSEIINEKGILANYKCYSFYQLAEINNFISDYDTAKTNYLKAIEMAEKLNNFPGLFRTYNGIANFFLSIKNFDECKFYLEKSLSIKGLSPSQQGRSICDLGIYYYEIGEHLESERILTENYITRKESGLEDASSTSLIALSKTQIALNKINEAEKNLLLALEITKKFNSKSKTLQCYQLLAQVYKTSERWKEAVENFTKYDELRSEQDQKQLHNIYLIKNKQIKHQKRVIEDIYNEVKDSINYAKRIQKAILPSQKSISQHLPQSFIIYKPKDIVAGDFYWLEAKDNKILFAVADCTGHGVPGAMVSVICNNGLNRSVKEYNLTTPSKILDKTRQIVLQEFEKSEDDVKDGMDIALCSLSENSLEYAGAHNPLWIIRDGQLIETKANKQPIGKFDNPEPYTNHKIELIKGDTIYLFTDGFVDQFGGKQGKKFKTKAFKDLLISIQTKSMDGQKQFIEEVFEAWKGDLEQIDDVCIIGVKV